MEFHGRADTSSSVLSGFRAFPSSRLLIQRLYTCIIGMNRSKAFGFAAVLHCHAALPPPSCELSLGFCFPLGLCIMSRFRVGLCRLRGGAGTAIPRGDSTPRQYPAAGGRAAAGTGLAGWQADLCTGLRA